MSGNYIFLMNDTQMKLRSVGASLIEKERRESRKETENPTRVTRELSLGSTKPFLKQLNRYSRRMSYISHFDQALSFVGKLLLVTRN